MQPAVDREPPEMGWSVEGIGTVEAWTTPVTGTDSPKAFLVRTPDEVAQQP